MPSSPDPSGAPRVRGPRPVPATPEYGPLVVLCGPMGSGKSTVGLALAKRWSVAMRDTDDDVVEHAGAPISTIFLDQGEQAFRDLEHDVVATALAEHRGILALGGGAVLRADTRAELAAYAAAGGVVVFLDVSIEYAAPRVGLDESRPLLMGDPRRRWLDIMRERREVYESVATIRTLTDGMTAAEVAREIERRLKVADRAAARSPRHTSRSI